MEKYQNINTLAILAIAILCTCGYRGVLAKVYTVGDSSGWVMGTDYSSWAADKTFVVGDSLVFNYPSGHTVDEVKAADYQNCATGNSISTDRSGATTLDLKTAGTHYYICGITGHCDGGMKLAVTVKASSSSAAAAPTSSGGGAAPSDTDTDTTTTTSPPSETTTGGSPATVSPTNRATPAHTDSSSSSLSAVVSLPHVAAVVGVVYMAVFKWHAV